MPRVNQIQVRRDTAANWTSVNPTLVAGEIGFETDTGKHKIGTGTAWNSLPYSTRVPTGGTAGQALTKSSSTDHATQWTTLVPAGGATGQVLAKSSGTDYATQWSTPTVPETPGLKLIHTQTIGTAVSSITVSDVFNATYDHYKILVTGGTHTGVNSLRVQFNNETSGTNYYGAGDTVIFSTGNQSVIWDNNVARFNNAGFYNDMDVDVYNPFLERRTCIHGPIYTNVAAGTYTGYTLNSISNTGFILSLSTGTMTGGTIFVYGYRKA
jgi:hypothetical protein